MANGLPVSLKDGAQMPLAALDGHAQWSCPMVISSFHVGLNLHGIHLPPTLIYIGFD
jgi:hypothetical protein